ncbi:glycosyltransferase family 2 protein [Winogradskyella alexanderae]|uniref:Glycosyltransferase n=1 Tax=Winogradskyella alexanderae TaxID=2877123 RepID=A0ABS7XRC5_9FLAO|nr:glycosyltransferase [Winogradskyella alexanderae]MCA0131978.1 glycosyltransferase [Winogradskyella alexanderae]
MQPLISIIIPTYNREKILIETLDSILLQTYRNWECIIVDDHSTDSTESTIKSFVDIDSRFQYFKRSIERPKGANACRNFGFEKSKGDFINWFDSDDVMHPDFLMKRVSELISDTTLDFCCCVYSTFTDKTEKKDYSEKAIKPLIFQSENYIEDYLLNGLSFITDSVLWRRKFISDKELFDETLHRAQEWDFHLRMLTYKPKYKYLKDVLFYLRQGNESITKNASFSLKAQTSIFKFFDNAFNIVRKSKLKHSKQLKQYIFYRQCVNYYNINVLSSGIKERFMFFKRLGVNIFDYTFNSGLKFQIKIRVLLGLLVLLFFNKGYKLLYNPKLDYRSYTR